MRPKYRVTFSDPKGSTNEERVISHVAIILGRPVPSNAKTYVKAKSSSEKFN